MPVVEILNPQEKQNITRYIKEIPLKAVWLSGGWFYFWDISALKFAKSSFQEAYAASLRLFRNIPVWDR